MIKAIQTYQGGEFTSNKFNQFCDHLGVWHSLTIPRSPQQNGVVERKNRTLLNMAHSLHAKKKEDAKGVWAEAVACAIYLNNRSPTKKKIDANDSTRSMEWEETEYFSFESAL